MPLFRRSLACPRSYGSKIPVTPYFPFSKAPKSGALARLCDNDLTLRTVNIPDDLTDFGNIDMPGHRIFDADDGSGECGLHIGTLKGKVRINHFTVYEFQIFAVAKRLCADNLAVFKRDAFAVPRKIFTLYDAVSYRDILCVPESIFGIEPAAFKNRI